jgi:type VI secretion system protein ImpK
MGTKNLISCFVEIIAYINYLVSTKEVNFKADQVRDNLEELFRKGSIQSQESGFKQEDHNNAKFAICAWIDETIMKSEWDQKKHWLKELIQKKHFKTLRGGILFFEKLGDLTPDKNMVREVYFCCLTLGFKGRYCRDGDEEHLSRLKHTNLRILSDDSDINDTSRNFFPFAYENKRSSDIFKGGAKSPLFSLNNIVWTLTPLVFTTLLYFLFRFVLDSEIVNMVK